VEWVYSTTYGGDPLIPLGQERARRVSQEIWHLEQESRFDEEGHYVLIIPYSNDTELVLDIMRYGPDVEVISPASLRKKVKDNLERAAAQYLVWYSNQG